MGSIISTAEVLSVTVSDIVPKVDRQSQKQFSSLIYTVKNPSENYEI